MTPTPAPTPPPPPPPSPAPSPPPTLFNPAALQPCPACGRPPGQPCAWTQARQTGDPLAGKHRPRHCNQAPDPQHQQIPY